MKKWANIIAASLAVYLLLVFLLLLSERGAAGNIHSFGDAVWYSLVTMTTVGYGDLIPVTFAGRVIGGVFLLCSLGLLALIVNVVFSLMAGRWLPQCRLWLMRDRTWYVFSQRTREAEALASDLLSHHPDALIVLCGCSEMYARGKVTIETNVVDFIRKHTFARERNVFLVGEDDGRNRLEASQLTGEKCRIYCKSMEVDSLPEVNFFDAHECCARSYWQEHPLEKAEQQIILIGDGDYAGALFQQAVLVNCMTPFRTVAYRLRGDWHAFRQLHPGLGHIFAETPGTADGKDVLSFEPEYLSPDQLGTADRIILCDDDFEENAKNAILLQRYFAVKGNIHALSDDPTLPGLCFGNQASLFTEALVMKRKQDALARSMHESFRAGASGSVPSWQELSSFLKSSNRAVADHLPVKMQLLREYGMTWENRDRALTELCRKNEHERWCRFHYLYNWSYAPVRDNKMRKHPCLLPFGQLSDEEQAKDDYAWEQIPKTENGEELKG